MPVGLPAMRALARWEQAGRPVLANERSGAALFLGARGGRLDPRTARRVVHARLRGADLAVAQARHGGRRGSDAGNNGRPRRRAARDQAHRGHPPARGRRRPAQRAGDPGPRQPGDDPDLHARESRAAQGDLPSGPPARVAGPARDLEYRARPGGCRLDRGCPSVYLVYPVPKARAAEIRVPACRAD